jgi:hypothetical protein
MMMKRPHALIATMLLAGLTGCQKIERGQPGSSPKAATVTPTAATAAPAHAHAHGQPCGKCAKAAPARIPKSCDRRIFRIEALKKGVKVLAGVAAEGESVPQHKLLEQAKAYEGKTVRVEGPIVSICQGMGCWAAIRGPKGKLVDLKVTDGVVDFRKIAKLGQYAVGEGPFSAATGRGRVKITGARISPNACR